MALSFNGTTQNVFWSTAPGLPATAVITKSPCSFSCWCKPAAFNNQPQNAILMSLDATTSLTNNHVWLYLGGTTTNNVPSWQTSTSGGKLSTPFNSTVSTGAWVHVAGTITSLTSRSIYVNGVGVADNVTTISFPIGQNQFVIGADYNALPNAENFFNGSVAFPAVWNVTLSQTDITALYNSGSGRDPREVQPSNLKILMLFAATNTFQDNIVPANIWTAIGSPPQVADPFVVGINTPVLTVQGASLVTATTATLNGTIVFTRGATPTIEGFNYGLTTGYGTNVSNTGTFSPGAYSIAITGLTPSTIYHFRAFATNSSGTNVSIDGFFTTKAVGIPPGTPVPFYDKLGYSCSFDQQGASPNWNPPKLMPLIAASGAMWIRDVVNWSVFEQSPGVYSTTNTASQIQKAGWMALIHTLGMKFCGVILYPPLFYPGNTKIQQNEVWPLPEFAAFCAWFANTGLVDVIELVNEANNVTQFAPPLQGGTLANLDLLVQMSVMARAAVRATGSTVPVISLDEQGDEITYMLQSNPLIDGVVYHPYDRNDSCPESTFETPFFDYVNWVRNVQAVTNLPIWETEFNGDNAPKLFGEYSMGLWLARRYLLSWWLGIPHTFIYNFSDPSLQTLLDFAYNPRQQYWVTQRTLLALEGVETTGQYVTATNVSAGVSVSDIMSTVFCSSTSTVASIWLGHHSTTQKAAPTPGTATISFRCLNTRVTDSIVDSMSGNYLPLSTYSPSLVNKVMTLTNYPITDTPQYITITGASQASAPLAATYLVTNRLSTSATLNGGITFPGGSSSTVTGFQYGTTTAYGSSIQTTQTISTGNFSNSISGLSAGTTYHYRSFSTNATGTGFSDDATFVSAAAAVVPIVGFGDSSGLSASDILLQSIIGESKQMILNDFAGAPDPLVHGALMENTIPEDYQNEYIKHYQQIDYLYRV